MRSLYFTPFDWSRFTALERALQEGHESELATLLAAPPAWRSAHAASKLASYEREGARTPGLRLELGLAAEPARFAKDAAPWLLGLDPSDARTVLVNASASAQPLELIVARDTLLAPFAASSKALPTLAFGGGEPGVHRIAPHLVREAAAQLAGLDLEGPLPADSGRSSDPDLELKRLVHASFRDLAELYTRAAREGWAVQVSG